MNTDFRISVSAISHPKIIKLMRRCGDAAFYSLLQLWTFTAMNKPDGNLSGMDAEDVEIAAKWRGEPGMFHKELVALRLLDEDEDGGLSVHDWNEHNGYASYAEARSAQAREAANIRWNKKRGNAAHDADGCGADAAHDADGCGADAAHDAEQCGSNAPSPSPSPAPSPAPYSGKDSCAEPAQAPPAAPEAPPPAEPAVLVFPLAKKGEEYHVTQKDVDEWQGSYPGIDVMQELRNCCQWNRDNPTRRKTKGGIRKHISGWLAREQNRGGGQSGRASPQQQQRPQQLTGRQKYMLEVGNLLKGQGYGSSFEQPNDIARTDAAPRALPGGGP